MRELPHILTLTKASEARGDRLWMAGRPVVARARFTGDEDDGKFGQSGATLSMWASTAFRAMDAPTSPRTSRFYQLLPVRQYFPWKVGPGTSGFRPTPGETSLGASSGSRYDHDPITTLTMCPLLVPERLHCGIETTGIPHLPAECGILSRGPPVASICPRPSTTRSRSSGCTLVHHTQAHQFSRDP